MSYILKAILTVITLLLAFAASINLLVFIGGFKDSPDKTTIFVVTGISTIFSLIAAYLVGNKLEGYLEWRDAKRNVKRLLFVVFFLTMIILAGLLIYFLYINMPLWAFVIAILLFLNLSINILKLIST